MNSDSGAEPTSEQVSDVWAAFSEVNRQLDHATDADVRIDLQIVKEQLRAQLAEIGDRAKPEPTRTELRNELESRERQLSKIWSARINITTQTGGDGAAPGGYGRGAAEINSAIDEKYGRAAIERRINELQTALEKLDADKRSDD